MNNQNKEAVTVTIWTKGDGKWRSKVNTKGKEEYYGPFKTFEEAATTAIVKRTNVVT